MSSLFNRSAPFSLRQRRGMTSKLKRPAPCFFPSGVEEGGWRSDRTTGIRELGGYTSLLLLAHRLEGGIQGPASSYRSPGTNTGTRFLIQRKIRRVTSLKLHQKNPHKADTRPSHSALIFMCMGANGSFAWQRRFLISLGRWHSPWRQNRPTLNRRRTALNESQHAVATAMHTHHIRHATLTHAYTRACLPPGVASLAC